MSGDWLAWLIAGFIGAGLGALAVLVLYARREQALRVEIAVLRDRVTNDAALREERERASAETRAELRGAFGALARDTLNSNSETFLKLARERLERQQADATAALRERENAIASLLQPIRDALAKTEGQIQTIERERVDSFATLRSHIETLGVGQDQLSRETRALVTALRKPEVRGRWGEITLRRLVELSGMSAHVDFTEQRHQSTDSGAVRPDMVVHLPSRRDIVIDVKTPLDAYLAALEADDDGRAAQLKRHAQILGARVRELASKRYWSQFAQSPEFAVLFLPGDQFLAAAVQENPELIEDALRQNVMLATPVSLVALLKTVEHGWRQTQLQDSALEIRRLGEELYRRLGVFGEHLGRLGKSLTGSVESFNKAVGSLEHQVLPAARRFPELGLRGDRELEVIEPIATLTRTAANEERPENS